MRIPNSLVKIIATFFYAGFFPLVSGTFASFMAAVLFYFVQNNAFVYWCITAVSIILGFLFSGSAERIFGQKDPRSIVIDEVAGMFLCMAFLPRDLKYLLAGFFLFRLLDTLKPFPAGRLQNLKGSTGIMLDDIVAALYTNIILQVVFKYASLRVS